MSFIKALVLTAAGALTQLPAGDTVADWNTLANKPATFPPSTHSHVIADVTGLQTALDGKAALVHSHIIADVTGLQTALDARELLINKSNDANLGLSTALYPTQAAVKTYVDQSFAANDAMVFKGTINASANPNYPAADAGHTYKVSVAGKIGGAAGPNVEIGDMLICTVDATAAGTHAAVGANWTITQSNIDGAVIGPATGVTNLNPAIWDGASGRLLKEVTYAAFKSSLAIAIADVASLQTSLDAKANLNSAIFTGGIEVSNTGPVIGWTETDQVDPAGRWRSLVFNGALYFQRSLAANWASAENSFFLSSAGVANFVSTPLVGGATIWHANNDGPASGLNADLLDGLDSAAFARLTQNTFTQDQTILRNATPTTGLLFFGNSGTKYLYWDATNFNFVGGGLMIGAGAVPTLASINTWTAANTFAAATFTGLITTNGQVAFPATQNPSADPTTLDDYEEGTFTPVVTASTTAPTGVTYSIQDGAYTKIGRVVTITYLRCVLTSLGTGGAGVVRVAGLPFAANGAITSVSSIMRFGGCTLAAGYYSCFWLISSTLGGMQQSGNTSAGADVVWTQLAANFNFISNAVYHV